MGKDVEDQFAAIGDGATEQPLKIAGLYWRQLSIGDHQGCLTAADLQSCFLQFSGSPEGLGVALSQSLTNHGNGLCPCAAHEAFKFGEIAIVAVGLSADQREQQHLFVAVSRHSKGR